MNPLNLDEAKKQLHKKMKSDVIKKKYKKVNKFQTLTNCKLTQENKEPFNEAMDSNKKKVKNLIRVDQYRKRKISGATKRKSLKHFQL